MKYYESFREQTNCHTVEGVLDYFNKRIRIDHYTGNVESIIQTIDGLAKKHSFTKCIIKGKESMFQHGSLSVSYWKRRYLIIFKDTMHTSL